MYQNLFFHVLEVSITVSIVILLAVVLMPVIERRYGFRWRKIFWMILAIRLLIPYNFTIPNAPVQLFESEMIVVQEGNHIYFTEKPLIQGKKLKTDSKKKSHEESERNLQKDVFQMPLLVLLGIVWGVGAFVYLRNQQLNYGYFLNDLDDCTVVKGGHRYEQLREVCKSLQIQKIPKLYINPKIMTPCITGYFRPVLLLPDTHFSERELKFIFLHECMHYKKHDLLYKLLILIAVGFHWFNPVVHYMKKLAFRDVELVCDKETVKNMSQEEKKWYCDTMIHTAAGCPFRELNLSTNFIGNKKILRQRMENVFDKTKRKRGVIPIVLISFAMLLGGALISCGKYVEMSQISDTEKKEPKENETQETVKIKKEKQQPIPFTLSVTEEGKEWFSKVAITSLEPFYCKEGRNWRSDYWIDEDGSLWEHNHSIAENVVHMRAEYDYEGNPILYYLTKEGKLYRMDQEGNSKILMEQVTYFTYSPHSIIILKEDGSVWVQGVYESNGYRYVENDPIFSEAFPILRYDEMTCILKNIVYITSENTTAAAITKDGTLVTWGSVLYGECGPNDKEMDILEPDERVKGVAFVWFDEKAKRMYIRKNDGSFWVCGEEVGAKKKKISHGREGGVKEYICTEQFMPLILETEE